MREPRCQRERRRDRSPTTRFTGFHDAILWSIMTEITVALLTKRDLKSKGCAPEKSQPQSRVCTPIAETPT
jgi:hypothetical protein